MKIGICAHLGIGLELLDGQVIKSKTLLVEMQKLYGLEEVGFCDTRIWKNSPLALIYDCTKLAYKCKNIVIMPADNGILVIPIIFIILRYIFPFKLHYVVVGGWLPEFLRKKKWLAFCLKKIDCIYVELHSLKIKLEEMGFANIIDMIAHDYQQFPIIKKEEIPGSSIWKGKFCFFSRIVKEKGIEDAIYAIETLNRTEGLHIKLDIFGQIDQNYRKEFQLLCSKKNDFIKYKGTVNFGKSNEVLKNYTALLFPSYFYGEGFAGVFIDAMAAGLPIIASKWSANDEIVHNMYNGLIFPVHDISKLQESIEMLFNNPGLVIKMKYNCLVDVKKYEPYNALKIFIKQLV